MGARLVAGDGCRARGAAAAESKLPELGSLGATFEGREGHTNRGGCGSASGVLDAFMLRGTSCSTESSSPSITSASSACARRSSAGVAKRIAWPLKRQGKQRQRAHILTHR